jgi:CRISPR type I-E-associated protein CasB/Cse2
MKQKNSAVSYPNTAGFIVASKIGYLKNSKNDSFVRATLAQLRQSLGRDEPNAGTLAFVFGGISEEQLPSVSKLNSIIAVLELFGKHQQGADIKNECMHCKGKSLAKAMKEYYEKSNKHKLEETKSHKHFESMLTSADRDELLMHLRRTIGLLKGIGFDYKQLANDVYFFDYPENREKIRLRCGRDFYVSNAKKKNDNNTTGKGEENE